MKDPQGKVIWSNLVRYKIILWVLGEHEIIFLDIVQNILARIIGFVAFLSYWDRSQKILLINYHLQFFRLYLNWSCNKTHILNKHIVIFKVWNKIGLFIYDRYSNTAMYSCITLCFKHLSYGLPYQICKVL